MNKEEIEEMKAQIKELSEKVAEVEKECSDKEFSGKWEDLEKLTGYYVESFSKIHIVCNDFFPEQENKNIVPSKKHAKSILAFCQLSQIVKRFNEESKPSKYDLKYTVYVDHGDVRVSGGVNSLNNPLRFNSFEDAKKSIHINENLWKDYFMID